MHAVQVISEARPDYAWVQLDVANAFPSTSRRAVLEALEEHASALLPPPEPVLRPVPPPFFLLGLSKARGINRVNKSGGRGGPT